MWWTLKKSYRIAALYGACTSIVNYLSDWISKYICIQWDDGFDYIMREGNKLSVY